jgi:hypothetical protein
LGRTVIVSICLCRNIFLGFLLRWHRELFFGWNTVGIVLGNSGKPVTLEMLSLTKFLRHVFQEQETHDFRKPGTCEASDSRIREVWGS